MDALVMSGTAVLLGTACGVAFAKIPPLGVCVGLGAAWLAANMGDYLSTGPGKVWLVTLVVSGALSWLFAVNT